MKVDLHIHSCYSKDGLSTPKSIVAKAKENGLGGIAITDHNLCQAWRELNVLCKKEGLLFVRGEEIKIKDNGKTAGELSGLFMSEEIRPGSFGEVVDALASQGAMPVIMHPFDWFRHPFNDLGNAIKRVKHVEVFNSRCLFRSMNQMALDYATKHGLFQTAGSDAHTPWEIGNAFIECSAESEEELRRAILQGETKTGGKLSSPLFHLFSPLAKNRILRKL